MTGDSKVPYDHNLLPSCSYRVNGTDYEITDSKFEYGVTGPSVQSSLTTRENLTRTFRGPQITFSGTIGSLHYRDSTTTRAHRASSIRSAPRSTSGMTQRIPGMHTCSDRSAKAGSLGPRCPCPARGSCSSHRCFCSQGFPVCCDFRCGVGPRTASTCNDACPRSAGEYDSWIAVGDQLGTCVEVVCGGASSFEASTVRGVARSGFWRRWAGRFRTVRRGLVVRSCGVGWRHRQQSESTP